MGCRIYERSPHDLDSRGGGIVLQAEVLEAFRRAGVHYDTSIGVEATERVFLDRSGGLARRLPMRQMLTSWTSLYGAMRRHFPAEHYHQGAELTDFGQSAERVEARFADGREVEGGLLVAADGGGSFVRRRLMPEVRADYAGYVAWRGLVDEPELTNEAAALLRDRFSFFEYANSHMLAYLVPGKHEAIEPGKRRYNWVWYRNAAENRLADLLIDAGGRQRASSIPPGLLSAASETDLREAAAQHLPPAYRALVAATREPFLQTIQDLSVRRMAVGRIAMVGDAAFIPRPHTAEYREGRRQCAGARRRAKKRDGYSGRASGLGARPDPIRAASAPPGQAAGRPVAEALPGTENPHDEEPRHGARSIEGLRV
jgi:2-polyprenyl-6-methoxyphenol hydroxylase-like FAD-dependent oxidoreductase